MLKAVLFDLDDTLIDWSTFDGDWYALEAKYLGGVFDYIRREIHPLDDLGQFRQEFSRRSSAAWTSARDTLIAPHVGKVLLETAVALGVPPGALDTQTCLKAYSWRAADGVSIFPDVPVTLRVLRKHRIKVGIVTNAFQPMALRDGEIKSHGLLEYFPDCRVSAADVGYLKPHPAIFQAALDCLDVRPDEAVFVGDDLEADIGGAQKAGLQAVWRRTSRREVQTLKPIRPDAIVDSLRELPAILDDWFPGWRNNVYL
jgi:HAD superfamily hydrolase (TIGR01509 family)